MKSSSKQYAAFLVAFFACLVFFIAASLVFSDNRKLRDENFNVSFKLTDYAVKINNAVYYTDSGELIFDLNIKTEFESSYSLPVITQIISDGNSKELDFNVEKSDETKSIVTVSGVDDNFYYIRVKLSSKAPDITPPPEVDEFGDLITHPTEEGAEVISYVYIDYRNVKFVSSKPSEAIASTTTAPMSATTPPIGTESTTTTPQTTSKTVTTTPIVTTTAATTTTKTTTPTAAVTTTEKPTTTVTTTTTNTKKVTTTTAKKPAATTTTTAKKPAETTTTTTKIATTTKKTTTKATTTTPKVTTTKKKTTTTTVTTTTLVPIPLRGLALKTSSPDNTVYIKVGETTTVTPVFTPAQATNKKVTWSSNREDRATIDQNGIVTGRSPGAVIIQCVADDGGLSAACMIVVTE